MNSEMSNEELQRKGAKLKESNKRCRSEGILKSDGYKELKRLEKAAKKGGAK